MPQANSSEVVLKLPEKTGQKQIWGQPNATASAWLIAMTAHDSNHPLLIITETTAEANRLEEEIRFFLQPSSSTEILHFPDWETLPYDTFSPHQDITSQRLETLYRLPRAQRSIVILSVTTLLQQIAPRTFVESNALVLNRGEPFLMEEKRSLLEQAGYHAVQTVREHGEFAVRGALMDIFPMGARQPYRIDLFDDEIDSLRLFDQESQRSIQQVEQIRLLPGHEFPLDKPARERFRSRFRQLFDTNHRDCPVYQDVGQSIASPGIEYYLPLFFEQSATLFDHLSEDTIIFQFPAVHQAAEALWQEVRSRFDRHIDPTRPLLPPEQLFLTPQALSERLRSYRRVLFSSAESHTQRAAHLVESIVEFTGEQDHKQFAERLDWLRSSGQRVLFVAESTGRREVLIELLSRHRVEPQQVEHANDFLTSDTRVGITLGTLENALKLSEHGVFVVPESVLIGQKIQQQRRRKRNGAAFDQAIRNLAELVEGAPVVHIDHGVGRYRGLQLITTGEQPSEFLSLEYADGAMLYVPVASLHLVSRYSGTDNDRAPLHRLGSEQWSKARKKATEKAYDAAAELLKIYANREARSGFACKRPDADYIDFANGFPFEETPDQQQAIEQVIADMTRERPMDRLICGDVGFGKTEVAMRAAFLAVQNGHQVAILVPTTLLAQQHYESFRDRFAGCPVNVDVASRFQSTKQINELKKSLGEGAIDIVIGTHKLLQGDLKFRRLGLLVIDEEHRFGVRQKEKFKAMRSEVDVLTLTATPIPRTLNMAMSSIRDLSIIATPPARRLSVKTFVRQHDTQLVREAVLRELMRGGQVYYLHNQVTTIEKCAHDLSELIPEARVAVGHGQMNERALEKVMSDFYHKRFNLLVCTTIIETGIDIPNANTIVIHRADKFGLAQLHQLRGRVGRSHHQAYAYLFTPPPKAMTRDASRRLEAISEAHDLGAGFTLASNDLEIRGAGELLGEEQSGQIQSIGFTLYNELLERAVKSIRSGEMPDTDRPLQQALEVDLQIQSRLPEEYIHDIHTRLVTYKRIATASDEEELKTLQIELIDRFGLLPDPAKNLFRQTSLRLRAEPMGIIRIVGHSAGLRIDFGDNTTVNPMNILTLVQSSPQHYKLEGSNSLKFSGSLEKPESRFNALEQLLGNL